MQCGFGWKKNSDKDDQYLKKTLEDLLEIYKIMYECKTHYGRSPNEERKKLGKIGSLATLDVFGDAPNKSCTILKKGLQSQGTLHMKVHIGCHIRWGTRYGTNRGRACLWRSTRNWIGPMCHQIANRIRYLKRLHNNLGRTLMQRTCPV